LVPTRLDDSYPAVTDYSIVIPAYDEELLLPATIAALKNAMAEIPTDGEIIVVDNNSKDATAEVARDAGVRVAFEPVNRISSSRNAGAKAAHGKWLVFVDADTQVPSLLLARAIEALANGETGGGGACIRFGPEAKASEPLVLRFWNWISRSFKLAAGSFIFCHRDGFDAVGGFSDKVYAGEEIIFSRRYKKWCRKRGLRFEVFSDHPVLTSARKLEWHSTFTLVRGFLVFLFCPFLVRSRSFCRFWYERPSASEDVSKGK